MTKDRPVLGEFDLISRHDGDSAEKPHDFVTQQPDKRIGKNRLSDVPVAEVVERFGNDVEKSRQLSLVLAAKNIELNACSYTASASPFESQAYAVSCFAPIFVQL